MRQNGFSKILLVLIAFVIVLIGFGVLGYYKQRPSTNPTSSVYYNKFTGPQGRFSFEYPSQWKVTTNEQKGEYIFDYPQDFVTVYVGEQGYTITEGSIQKNFSETIERLKAELTSKGATNFSQSQFKKGDTYFFRLDYDAIFATRASKGIYIYAVKGNRFYGINMATPESNYGRAGKDFEHLIETFE